MRIEINEKRHWFEMKIGNISCEEDFSEESLSEWEGETPEQKYKEMLKWFNGNRSQKEEERSFVKYLGFK